MPRHAAQSKSFDEFVEQGDPKLRRALVATYGPTVGREAALDALSWAWEHWDRVETMTNPVGYLYRVGQTAAKRLLRPTGVVSFDGAVGEAVDFTPELLPALTRLSEQQRAVVVLVHGYGFPQREVGELLDISVSTVREHLARGMASLRTQLEVPHD
jgi:DNA-directed RNA polymerase specialized sigma24 family protein